MNVNCRVYALPSLCFSILPECRTPHQTNQEYFTNRAIALELSRQAEEDQKQVQQRPAKKANDGAPMKPKKKRKMKTTTVRTIVVEEEAARESEEVASGIYPPDQLKGARTRRELILPRPYPPTRNTENLRRICRSECELLENELCQKEYAIAKRHPTIGQKLNLENCFDLPDHDDCLPLGITIDAQADDTCYNENGVAYRGTMGHSATGRKCLKWSRVMKEIALYPELAGQNYCR